MIAKFFAALKERVITNYKSTLLGLLAGVAVYAVDLLVPVFQSPDAKPWQHALAALLVLIGASLRSKALPPAP